MGRTRRADGSWSWPVLVGLVEEVLHLRLRDRRQVVLVVVLLLGCDAVGLAVRGAGGGGGGRRRGRRSGGSGWLDRRWGGSCGQSSCFFRLFSKNSSRAMRRPRSSASWIA